MSNAVPRARGSAILSSLAEWKADGQTPRLSFLIDKDVMALNPAR
jgi:hypothetical protein